jgi:predicted negative regulator of RcsB-dependent stress response
MHLIIKAQAQFYTLSEYDDDVALALAWEDFDLACRARGEPCITGAVFQLWSRLPKKKDKEFKEVLNRALAQAQYQTDSRLFRYPERARLARIQTLEDGFDEAEATPLEFRDIQAWVSKRDAEAEAKAVEKKAPAAKLSLVDVPVLDTMPGKSVDDEDDIF